MNGSQMRSDVDLIKSEGKWGWAWMRAISVKQVSAHLVEDMYSYAFVPRM